ncbi:MAG: glucose-6-phosphate isomerase, partial [Leucobacter sp.]
QVSRALGGDLARTVVVVSSKSGSTIETRSHRATFEDAFRKSGIDPAERIIIVTDPGSPLEASAKEAGQRVFLADPNVGGRYSALTAFGLVPSGLAGADIRELVAEAESVRGPLSEDVATNPGLQLAATLGAGLPDQYAVAIASAADAQWGLGEWVEQLIAESTGKEGVGILPIALPADAPELSDSLPNSAMLATVSATATEPVVDAFSVTAPLGAQMLLWEVATAVVGRVMKINPFDQPDVESAKIAARKVLDEGGGEVAAITELPAGIEVLAAADNTEVKSLAALVEQLRSAVPPNGYVSVQAYLDRESAAVAPLETLRNRLTEVLGVPVTLGWGPRFLHSTGQLHKGGPALGVFLQFLDAAEPDLSIPGSESGFGTLITAQAAGDRQVLKDHGRPVFALRSADPVQTVGEFTDALSALTFKSAAE